MEMDTASQSNEQPRQPAHLDSAAYPIPLPLSRLLRATILEGREAQLETLNDALAQLVGNSFEAMDSMYFSTPAPVRNQPTFAHKLCIRVAVDKEKQTLSITDLGSGLTRADLINGLGIGHLSHGALAASKRLAAESSTTAVTMESEEKQGEDGVGKEVADGDTVASEDDDDETSVGDFSESSETPDENDFNAALPCRSLDIGGFYSALCSIGTQVSVGTKSKFDDYYEFQVGRVPSDCTDEECFARFSIVRPMREGVVPTADNGYDKFEDVRGESGTRVTIRLNQRAIDTGFLNEDRLKPFFAKILESSEYTVAFSTDPDAPDIIDASKREDETVLAALDTGERIDLLEATSELSIDPVSNGLNGSNGTRHNSIKERSKYIPIRLSLGERKMLRLVEAAMTCCDYTTEVDRPFKSEARRTHAQLKGITSILRGLVSACDYKQGQELVESDNFAQFETFYQQMFEIARRHKIMNPEKMRTEYGKLIYLLQDFVSPMVQPHLSFSCKGKVETVYKFLEERGGLALLDDKYIGIATAEVLPGKKTRAKIAAEIKTKERAVATLKAKYRSSQLSTEDIHLCLYSLGDNDSFLNSNRVPIDKVIHYLKTYFSPEAITEGYSLSIMSGQDGARLSHCHERQYYYALQSLTLWRDIIDDMFRLWHMAEEDLLSETVTYALQDTGQGMQRVQQSPRTYKAMQSILARVQSSVSVWVGSSVIHLGDHNVPNALSFIDKYNQVPRILGPIVSCLENLERICEKDDGIKDMIDDGYGGIEKLRKDILYDFFKSAFDGSGADTFYDAGSCIDGRMTSAWNWCSQLPTKPFYPIFKLTGFTSFDGEFK